MTSLSTAYTPLETLLLFQALRAEGVGSLSVFNRISDQLQLIPLVRDDPSYDPSRLTPDALRDLYLALLKEEVRRDIERNDGAGPDAQTGSRKRKAPSPTLPTVQEASQHRHLIPRLVARLYVRYRQHAIENIRDQERRYAALTHDIDQIEAGKWDDKSKMQLEPASNPAVPVVPPRIVARTDDETAKPLTVPTKPEQDVLAITSSTALPPNGMPTVANGLLSNGGGGGPRTISSGPDIALRSDYQPNASPISRNQVTEFQQGQIPHTLPASTISPTIRTQIQPASIPPSSHTFPTPSHSPVSSQPITPTYSVGTAPGGRNSPFLPVHAPSYGAPQSAAPTLMPNRNGHAAMYGPAAVTSPPSHHVQQEQLQRQQRQQQQQQYLTVSQPQIRQTFPQPDHVVHSQEASTTKVNGNLPPHQSMSQPQSSPAPLQRQKNPSSAPATERRASASAHPTLISQILSALATPTRSQRTPVWKSERQSSELSMGSSLPQPGVEPLSPVQTRASLVAPPTRTARGREPEVAPPPVELAQPDSGQSQSRVRVRPKRERSTHSVVSSIAEGSTRVTRSQSVSTTAGPPPTADDRPDSRGTVKAEPSTPAALTDDHNTPRESSATPVGARATRKRRGTPASQTQPPVKRVRRKQSSPPDALDTASDTARSAAPRQATITAYRNFAKLSATITNDINSHKHASYFAHMVREKDAPGYGSIIKRPQHLKSIRNAITAGARAVNAAAATLEASPATGSTDGSAATIELKLSDDLVPPQAIVNGAQLEKEVMRMLANAVMFNPGDDGMVRDTREMFEDVEAQIRQWRGADRENTADSLPAGRSGSAVEDGDEGKGKRRKF